MHTLNQLILEGNIVHLQDKVSTANGFTVKRFSIAVNREYHNAEGVKVLEASYFDVDAFGNLAESAEKWGERGRGVRIVGRLKQDRWEDAEGKSHSKVKVIAEHIEFKPKDETVPLKWTDLKIGDKLRYRNTGVIHMVTGMDPDVNAERHVLMGCTWYSDSDLASWERAEDYHG